MAHKITPGTTTFDAFDNDTKDDIIELITEHGECDRYDLAHWIIELMTIDQVNALRNSLET